LKRETYYHGAGMKWGIYNTAAKEFQFGICEDSPMLAEARLFFKIGDNARKYRFEARSLPKKKEAGNMNRDVDPVRAKFQTWMRSIAMAASVHCYSPDSIYYGPEGAKRLGRECGPALLDFGEFGIGNIGATYSAICVIAYQLKPPIDAKDWLAAVREGYDRAKAWQDRREVPELHDEERED